MVRETENHGWPAPEVEDSGSVYVEAFDTLIDTLDDEVIIRGELGDRPAAGEIGRCFLEEPADVDDTPTLYYDNGQTWEILTSPDVTDLDGSGGLAGDFLTTDGEDIFWSGDLGGLNADTVDDYHGVDLGALAEAENVTEAWRFDAGLALNDDYLRFRGRSDDEWAAHYTTNPTGDAVRATNEMVEMGVWSSGSGDTGYGFIDQFGNLGLEIVPETGTLFSHGQVYSNGHSVAEKSVGQRIHGLWTFDNVLQFADQGFDPGADGRIVNNGGDLKVRSGGAVRNLSDIGETDASAGSIDEVQDNGDAVEDGVRTLDFGEGVDARSTGSDSVIIDAEDRGRPNLHFPYTELEPGDHVAQPVILPANAELFVYGVTIITDQETIPSSVWMGLYDHEDDNTINLNSDQAYHYNDSANLAIHVEGSYSSPHTFEFQLINDTSSTYNIGGSASYRMDDAGGGFPS